MTITRYWHSQQLKNRTGSEIFAALFSSSAQIATLLESPYPNDNQQLARYSICAGAPRVIKGKLQMWTPQLGEILPFLQNIRFDTSSSAPSVPFTGGLLGWLGYDFAWEIEKLPHNKEDSLPFPVAYWYEPESFAVLDHTEQILWLSSTEQSHIDKMQTLLEQEIIHTDKQNPVSEATLHTLSSQEQYENAVRQAKKYIQAGDIFQANLSLRFTTEITVSGWEIYQALQKINPSPFACYYKTPWGEVVSCSPERLVCKDVTCKVSTPSYNVSTRPIAGTRRRGATPEHDEILAKELLSNTKELAEHIMLVDLERNDLGRVCEWGTVEVDELLTIERYSHVMHLVSNVVGKLKPDLNVVDLIGAMFPGGTITGCPKIRCMEIIEELEPVRRSLFYGSCGYINYQGNIDLNILIRTLLVAPNGKNNTVWGQVGAGIVADSDPEKEWYESLQKAEAQLTALRQLHN
jgi:para-aminobenzoate synthetase component I